MKRFWLGLAATAAVSACSGGNPFTTETDTEVPESGIPEVIAGDLSGISYDPVAQTLTVRGISLDETPFEATYRRRPGMDRGGYEAYTAQDSSLDRHTTAYVRDINGTRAAVVVTGGQFEHYFGGAVYGRNGAFDPPPVEPTANNGLVSYAGTYVGLLNGPGDGGDLLPVSPGTPASVLPVEAGEVTGRVLINADFTDNVVNGVVFDRVYVDTPSLVLNDLALKPTDIDPSTGTFSGEVTINLQNKGTYGGIFGGADSDAVAGALKATDHIDNVQNEEEFGIFVLPRCGTPGEDALCNQPNP
ncbi:MAG: thymidylate synthase [Pseudomonadota bacterium]|nr:thymidylate synthase [Pseudomonadota bacterium]